MDAKHTSGPWVAQAFSQVNSVSGGGEQIAHVFDRRASSPIDAAAERGANSTLIAAAPDLLEACETVLEEMEDAADEALAERGHHVQPGSVKVLRSAIAKAKGERHG